MRKNTASQVVAFQMVSSTDGSDVTAGSPTVYYTIDGGTQATGSGTSTHEGNGQWSYAPTQAETNGDHVAFTMVLTGAVSQCVNVYPVSYDPTSASLGLNDPTAAAIADAVWDEAASAHTAPGSFGRKVRNLGEGLVAAEGQVNDLSATTGSFVTNLAEATDEHYRDAILSFISGVLAGQSRTISAYNGTTKAVTLDQAFTEAPANADEFLVLASHQYTATEISDSVLTRQLLESYAADGTAPTLAQAIFAIQQFLQETNVSGTTLSVKRLDGSTTAMTFTLDDAVNPTSITRAT